jgi:hypothetical protein
MHLVNKTKRSISVVLSSYELNYEKIETNLTSAPVLVAKCPVCGRYHFSLNKHAARTKYRSYEIMEVCGDCKFVYDDRAYVKHGNEIKLSDSMEGATIAPSDLPVVTLEVDGSTYVLPANHHDWLGAFVSKYSNVNIK